jgi:hypothetical protein
LLKEFRDLNLEVSRNPSSISLTRLEIRNELREMIRIAQSKDMEVMRKESQPGFSQSK